jgi:hypothetical protein
MLPPRVVAQDGMGGRRLARSFCRSAAPPIRLSGADTVSSNHELRLQPLATRAAHRSFCVNAIDWRAGVYPRPQLDSAL